MSAYKTLKRNHSIQLEELQTGRWTYLSRVHLKAQIYRELDRLEMILTQLKTIEEERDALLGPVSDKALSTPPRCFLQLKGIGTELSDDCALVRRSLPPLRQSQTAGRLRRVGADAVAKRTCRRAYFPPNRHSVPGTARAVSTQK